MTLLERIQKEMRLSLDDMDALKVEVAAAGVAVVEPEPEVPTEPEPEIEQEAEIEDPDDLDKRLEALQAQIDALKTESAAHQERAVAQLSLRLSSLVTERHLSREKADALLALWKEGKDIEEPLADAMKDSPRRRSLSKPFAAPSQEPEADESGDRSIFLSLIGRFPKDGEAGEVELKRIKQTYPEHFGVSV